MSSFTFAAVGDAIFGHRCSQKKEKPFLDLVDLVRSTDASFVNFEMVTPRPPLIPSAEHGGVNLGMPEYVIDELKWMGFNLFGVANNHSNDFTWKGLVDTLEALREHDVTFAGGGMNLGEARSPAYFESEHVRVALLAATASYTVGSPAAPVRQDFVGRPGISHLRVEPEYVLSEEHFAAARALSEALGIAETVRERQKTSGAKPDENVLDMMFTKFLRGDACLMRNKMNEKDLDDICKWIADAKRQAEFVVMSFHAHHGMNRKSNSPELAEFIPAAAHRFVDAGADVVVGHGPHMLRAMELYKGKPIFYSLGNFFYRSSQVARYPAEIYEMVNIGADSTPADVVDSRTIDKDGHPKGFNTDVRFWQSVIPVCRYDGLELKAIDLYPIDLQFGAAHRARRGEPRLSDAQTGQEILQRLASLSAPFGVNITVDSSGDRVTGHVAIG
jgi:poly-gamma-glutamate synthesis protein (capsule biosynthesis protein)